MTNTKVFAATAHRALLLLLLRARFIAGALMLLACLLGVSAPAWGQTSVNYQKIALLKWYTANQTAGFQVGNNPSRLVFDGSNIWVTNAMDNTVTKLQASDGANLGTFVVGSQPAGIAFDGANIWVANFYGDAVTKLRASDGVTLGTYSTGPASFGPFPASITFDGANIWVTNMHTMGGMGIVT